MTDKLIKKKSNLFFLPVSFIMNETQIVYLFIRMKLLLFHVFEVTGKSSFIFHVALQFSSLS